MLDYGNDGQIKEVECDDVEYVIDNILEYFENRMTQLDVENRHRDILAICQEYQEWGTADNGDEIGYLFMPRLADD